MKEEKERRSPKRLLYLLAIACLSALLGGCGARAPVAAPGGTATGRPTATAPAIATAKSRRTPSPTATGIPGFEGWSVVNPQDVDIQSDKGSLVMTLTHRALWFMQQRGVLLYKPVTGNFRITAEVHTSRSSDPNLPPGGDGKVQLAGVMARNGESTQENYVFIVVGDDANGLSVETKNTVDSFSKFDGPDWGSPEAELRLCRFGSAVSVYKRRAVTGEAWTEAASFERPDLPETLQVGANIYTDAAPDLQARYDHITIDEIAGQSECAQ